MKVPVEETPLGDTFDPKPGELWIFGENGKRELHLDLTSDTNLGYTFYRRKDLTELPDGLETFNGATSTTSMFYDCSSLKVFEVAMPGVVDPSWMF